MNAIATSCPRRVGTAILLLLAALLAGCATHHPKIDWAARVGVYTYDQAVVELGPPDKQAKLADGSLVADWLLHRGYTYVSPVFAYGNCPYWTGAPLFPSYTQTPDYF